MDFTFIFRSDTSLKQSKTIIGYIILGILTFIFRSEMNLKQDKTVIK
jgi:hypothetical protein